VKIWTVHSRAGRAPVLIPEKFSWGGLVFGPLWLLAHGSWIPGVIALAVCIALAVALPPPLGTILDVALFWAIGLAGNDLRRWSLARRGFALVQVVAERNTDAALARLLDRRPDLIGGVPR
jgi:hypothetical protein